MLCEKKKDILGGGGGGGGSDRVMLLNLITRYADAHVDLCIKIMSLCSNLLLIYFFIYLFIHSFIHLFIYQFTVNMSKSVSHPISTRDYNISPRAEGPMADIGRGLIWGVNQILTCIVVFIIYLNFR